MYMDHSQMRLTFTLEILLVVTFQRWSDCNISKSVIRQVVIRLKTGVRYLPLLCCGSRERKIALYLFKHFFSAESLSMVELIAVPECEDLGSISRPSGNRRSGEMTCSSSHGKRSGHTAPAQPSGSLSRLCPLQAAASHWPKQALMYAVHLSPGVPNKRSSPTTTDCGLVLWWCCPSLFPELSPVWHVFFPA